MFFEDEEFEFNEIFITVYCFFTSREESVGLTILEGLEVIQDKFNTDTGFILHLSFTQEGDIRLTENWALEKIKEEANKGEITKIFVCGPPKQNRIFNKISAEARKIANLNEVDYIVL